MKKKYYLLVASFLLGLFSQAQTIALEAFGPSFDKPVNIKNAGDSRLFVVEQDGVIQILNSNGTVTQFLDIDSRVFPVGGIGDERGLLGLTFHPDYTTNGFFYVNYINNSGNTVISRFTRSTTNPDTADDTTELILLSFNQPASNHNGGDLAFGPDDGYLYIATGDGGGGGDQSNNSQTRSNLLGNILRIDVDNPDTGLNYGIPADNPFISDSNARDEIWAYGLRNPVKFSFDREDGAMWIGDVGQSNREEINRVEQAEAAAGLNYGWRCYEGNSTFNTTGCPDMNTLTFPVNDYPYGGNPFRCAITGGYRYNGTIYPNMLGLYFFADYCSDEIGYLTENSGSTWTRTFTTPSTPSGNEGWVAFGEDIAGELYVAGINTGQIFKITDESLSVPEFETQSFKLHPNPAKTKVTLQLNNYTQNTSLNIYNVLGKKIKTITINTSNYELNTSSFSRGIYLMELIDSSGNKQTKKLVLN